MKFTLAAVSGLVTMVGAFSPSSFVNTGSVIHRAPVSSSTLSMKYKVAVIGGGPSGSCAAEIFAQDKSIDTVFFERKLDNAKPCGGAIPLCMVGEFNLPETVVDRKVRPSTIIHIFEVVREILLFVLSHVRFSCFHFHLVDYIHSSCMRFVAVSS